MPKQMIPLSEAVILTGKNDSTIRRFFKKPENKPYSKMDDGKLYVDKDILLAQYAPTSATPEPPKQRLSAVDNAIEALVSQLEAKDRQIDNLSERLREANYTIQTNAQKALAESNQKQTETNQEYRPQPIQEQAKTKLASPALIAVIVALILVVSWIVYSESTRAEKVPEIGEKQDVSDNRSYVKKIIPESDSTRTSVVPMDSTIQN
jgi:hypothetical protein